jgi:hypothetical protein
MVEILLILVFAQSVLSNVSWKDEFFTEQYGAIPWTETYPYATSDGASIPNCDISRDCSQKKLYPISECHFNNYLVNFNNYGDRSNSLDHSNQLPLMDIFIDFWKNISCITFCPGSIAGFGGCGKEYYPYVQTLNAYFYKALERQGKLQDEWKEIAQKYETQAQNMAIVVAVLAFFLIALCMFFVLLHYGAFAKTPVGALGPVGATVRSPVGATATPTHIGAFAETSVRALG